MEIRDQRVHDAEPVPGIDKNIVFAFGLAGPGIVFQSTSDRGAERNNPWRLAIEYSFLGTLLAPVFTGLGR